MTVSPVSALARSLSTRHAALARLVGPAALGAPLSQLALVAAEAKDAARGAAELDEVLESVELSKVVVTLVALGDDLGAVLCDAAAMLEALDTTRRDVLTHSTEELSSVLEAHLDRVADLVERVKSLGENDAAYARTSVDDLNEHMQSKALGRLSGRLAHVERRLEKLSEQVDAQGGRLREALEETLEAFEEAADEDAGEDAAAA